MYTKYENGSRRHQFVSEEMSKDELKEETLIRGISNSTVDIDKREQSSNNEKKERKKERKKKERKNKERKKEKRKKERSCKSIGE